MTKQKKQAEKNGSGISGVERLALRVSAMINAPKAQADRQVTIYRLDTDPDDAWEEVLELLREEEGIEMWINDEGDVKLRWALPSEGDHRVEEVGEMEVVWDKVPF
ncbi:DUF1654 domain-containing protein [Pseudomonas sp. UBA6310]|uniref:DUF1654 domain-containing protein n=1 Tax=Pseudomonas sp. UBA6310 TaxID=1947327 RepID=UPI00257E981B|nr:DUF1654 domain-containing protein [Pseudomonas sp. UBA6310]